MKHIDGTLDLLDWAEEHQRAVNKNPVSDEKSHLAFSCVVLVDAFSQIFRSFYAIRRLNNRRGEPVNALYVMTKLLFQLHRMFPERHGAFLFDSGKVAFRLELHPEYKANRPPMPEDLRVQMPMIEDMISAFGWQLLRAENYEADDLIGAFATNVDAPVKIVTSDKDLASLVNERVHLFKPARSGGGFQECGVEEVINDFGIVPELIPDYLALIGDNVDNITGVPGIGPKSAAELLNSYGPLANWFPADGEPLFAASGKFAGKLNGKQALLERNLKLTRLKCVLPEEFQDIGRVLECREPDWQKIADICTDNDFRSLLKELPPDVQLPSNDDELF